MNENDASRDKLWKMVKDIRFAMFTTRHGNGHLHARPMTTQNKELGADDSLDDSKKRQLWNKITEAWFPGGPTDPDVALVQVRIVHASYWDVKDSKLVQLYAMAKAVVSGKPPTQLGEHGEVRMR